MNGSDLPTIDEASCTACGVCVQSCPTGAVSMGQRAPVFTSPEACTYCGICEDLCPSGAIELEYEIQ